jgi:hypothetical protein
MAARTWVTTSPVLRLATIFSITNFSAPGSRRVPSIRVALTLGQARCHGLVAGGRVTAGGDPAESCEMDQVRHGLIDR